MRLAPEKTDDSEGAEFLPRGAALRAKATDRFIRLGPGRPGPEAPAAEVPAAGQKPGDAP